MTTSPEVAAIYCPLWHNYDHATSWKGEGWCEWELLKKARPRFEGHYQPYVPEWGHFDESDPAWSAKEIDLAADYGVDVLLVDWYWYSGVRIMEEALERGLLQAKNNQRVKFALMWANHDWADYFPPPFGQKWNSWLPSRHSAPDWLRVVDYCIEHYFNRPHYWRLEDELFFSLFQPLHFVRQLGGARSCKSLLGEANRRLAQAKLPPLHLNGMLGTSEGVDELMEAGFASTTTYNIITSGIVSPNLTERYTDLAAAHPPFWQKMAATALPYMPIVTMGWDVTPRCEESIPWPFPISPLTGKHDYPYISVVEGNTPQHFKELCQQALDHCRQAPHSPQAVFINAWNEWTEGSFLLPEARYGNAYLQAVKETFKRENKSSSGE